MKLNSEEFILGIGRNVLNTAAESILYAESALDESFVRAVKLMAMTNGKIIFSGIGKSGIIAKKLSSTLSSTGTFGHYIHPVDALHGDLGMIREDDTLVILSNSGNSSEIIVFLENVKNLGFDNKIIVITAKNNSKMCEYADVILLTHVTKETTNEDILLYHMPTTSTTVTLVIGDALISAVHLIKGSESKEFIKYHPGGNIGKLLNSATMHS